MILWASWILPVHDYHFPTSIKYDRIALLPTLAIEWSGKPHFLLTDTLEKKKLQVLVVNVPRLGDCDQMLKEIQLVIQVSPKHIFYSYF